MNNQYNTKNVNQEENQEENQEVIILNQINQEKENWLFLMFWILLLTIIATVLAILHLIQYKKIQIKEMKVRSQI